MRKKELTPLHWFVYNLLKEKTLGQFDSSGNPVTVSQREIYEACVANGFPVTWTETQNQHNDHCRWLKNIIDELIAHPKPDFMPWHHGYRYYLCTEEQAQVIYDFYDLKIKHASVRRAAVRKKIKRNGQGKLLSAELKPITEKSQAKRFYTSFNEEGVQNNG